MRNFFLFNVLLFSIALRSQGVFPPIQIKSPQSYAFEKYGNVPVNLYTGAIDLKIPITSIDENGVNIPVSISYDSSGFFPHKKPDLAGINWSLIAGGRITRTVNGIPDEYIGDLEQIYGGSFYGYSKRYSGFLVGTRNSPHSNYDVYNLQAGPGIIDPPGQNTFIAQNFVVGPPNKAYEGDPDLFSFNVMGISGKFMVGNNGKVVVQSDDPNIKVDLSEMNTYSATNFCGNDLTSSIKITDGKGNQYIFGGDMSKFELSYPSNDIYFSEGFIGVPVINSFSISKIILSDGKTIDFEYYSKPLTYEFCHGPVRAIMNSTYEPLFSIETYYQQGTRSTDWNTCTTGNPFVNCFHVGSSMNTNHEFFSLLKKSLLTSIKYNGNEIKINYKSVGYSLKHWYFTPKSLNEYVIDNIETYSNSKLLKSTTFSYDNFGGIHQRPFLKSVKENETNKEYSFEYTGTYNLPPYYTKGIDHWGYWNGNEINASLAPYTTYDAQTGDYDLVGTNRDPSPVFYSTALLNKVVYPTKGSTEFEYEPHDYNQRLERTSATYFYPGLKNKQGIAGGARIHKIKNYSASGILSTEKEYRYTKTLYDETGTVSSGILMNWPRYHYFFKFDTGNNKAWLLLTNSSNHQTNSLDSYNVGYSTVFEIEKNNGYKEYNFTDYNTDPDGSGYEGDSDLNTIKYANIMEDEYIQPLDLYKNLQTLYRRDKSVLRGRLKYEKFFKEPSGGVNRQYFSDSPQKVIQYEYYDNENYNSNTIEDDNNFVSIYHMSALWVQATKKFFNSSHLQKKIVRDYDNNGEELNSYTEYFYNSPQDLNISEEKTVYSDNSEFKTTYQYTKNLLIGDPNQPSSYPAEYKFVSSMFRKNMLSIPLIKTEYKNNIFLKRSQTLYNFDNNLTVPTLPFKDLLYAEDKVNNIGGVNGTYSVPIISFGTQLLSYDQYDSAGNLLQFTTKSGSPTCIIWGYNKKYPIAKIEGAKLSDIAQTLIDSIVDASDQSQASYTETNLLSKLEAFRMDNTLKVFQITTFTHRPLIGVSSITPPSGIREVYIYDTANRLEKVVDINGKILKEYKYNYKQ